MDFTTTSAVAYGSGGAIYNGLDVENKGPGLHASSSNNPLNYHSPGAGDGTNITLSGLRASAVATARKASGQRVPFATDSTGAHFEVGFMTSFILHFRDPLNAQTNRSLIFIFSKQSTLLPLERQLLELNKEKTVLDSEYNKLLPKASRTIANRNRLSEIEQRLREIDLNCTSLRSQIKATEPDLER